jgi:hypothetical protein
VKTTSWYQTTRRWILIALPAMGALLGTSCMTTYDAYGRPVQSVDPALAVAGVATAGLVGYALANDHNDYSYHQPRPSRPSRPQYHGGHYGSYGGGPSYRPQHRPYPSPYRITVAHAAASATTTPATGIDWH